MYFEETRLRFFDENDFDRILSCLRSKNDDFYLMTCLLLYECAARLSEAVQVRFSDYNTTYGELTLPVTKRREEVVCKKIKISQELVNLMAKHKKTLRLGKNDFILVRKKGNKPLFRHLFIVHMQKVVLEALGENHYHKANASSIRHSKAIHMLRKEKGKNIQEVKKILGHKSVLNTTVYLQYI